MPVDSEAIKQAVRAVFQEQKICIRLENIEVMLRGRADDRNDRGMLGDVSDLKRDHKAISSEIKKITGSGRYWFRNIALLIIAAIVGAMAARLNLPK